MTLEGARRQSAEAPTARRGDERAGTSRVREEVVDRDNLTAALARVRQNRGSPGSDGMTPEELLPYLREHGPRIRAELLAGTYQPPPVKRGEIPKPGGGMRHLGIPTVLDRFLQQAILQVLQPRFDPTFSEHSYGFHPERSAQQAIAKAHAYVAEGRRYVVDVDLEKFFARVNHDVLMGRLAKRSEDKGRLRLIRRYLEAGIMGHGVAIERHEGTPHGGPLTPPTIWQNTAVGTCGTGSRRHPNDDGHVLLVDFHTPDQGPNDLTAGPPIGGRQSTAHFGNEVLQLADNQLQVALLSRIVRELV